ncbi:MAG TPA: transcription antitermination factor NusB [Elusimicrobiota bacterium]|nr:transcription antitermination factor NusB [Elusimicrobiota bacterium]
MGRRRQAREVALQALYLADTARMSPSDAYAIVRVGAGLDAPSDAFTRELIDGASARKSELDERIARVAENWALDRMAAVDRNLLRLSAFELLFCLQTPVKVAIDEALEIAKIYSSAESSKFINGILDKIKAERPAQAE